MYRMGGKRLLDLVLAALAGCVLAPLFGLIALAVRVFLGSPVIYRQLRAGKDGRVFTLYKFRTMTDARDATGRLLPDSRRLTRLGAALRRSSLDELPQLWNVLRGDMSLVGPRPLLPEYLQRYSRRQMRRHRVRPGITGWAQVGGRNRLAWDDRLARDVWYVGRVSFWWDVKILMLTVARVLMRDGISADQHATMPEFLGAVAGSLPISNGPASRSVHVIGAGGHAKVVIATLEASGWTVKAVYDDQPALWGKTVLGHPIQGPVAKLASMPGAPAIIAVGDPSVRERIARQMPLNWVSVVHPAATVHASVRVGAGTAVFAGAVVQPDVVLGQHVIVNTGAMVDHDGVIGDFANIGPGTHLAGGVQIGSRSELGTGCILIPCVQVGGHSIVGAGAVLIHDVPHGVVVAGCPARVLRVRTEQPPNQEANRVA
jgi:sugar O-acyltransferase (sialic acid O-acetyltransferase NeuD family)